MEYKICVIVPVRDDSNIFRKCVMSLLDLDYEKYEIIIVDDSEKGIIERISFPREIKVINSFGKGPSYARNLAAKNTDAEFLAFTDSDCLVDKSWLKELLKGFKEEPDAAACGGVQRLPQDATKFEKRVFAFMKKVGFITDYIKNQKSNDIVEVTHNASCNVMYKRDIFLREGGFLEGLWPGEDVELDYRLKKKGYKIIFNPKAVVYHYRPKDIKSFSRMMFRYGWSQGFLVRKYGICRRIQILPLLSVLSIGLFLLSIVFNIFLRFLAVISLALVFFLGYLGFDFYVFILSILSFVYWHCGFLKGLMSQERNNEKGRII